MFKIQNNRSYKVCDNCLSSVVTDSSDESVHSISTLVSLKCYKKNSLVYSSKHAFDTIVQAEILFRKKSEKLIEGELTLKTLTSAFINISNNVLPNCHGIFEKIITLYFRTRLYILLRKCSLQADVHQKQSVKCASRSVGMRIAVDNIN